MRLLISLVSFLLTLAGCDPEPGITTLTVSSIDGVRINASKATVAEGRARFECVHSASGRCHYLVFVRDCAAPRADAQAECTARTLRRFHLDSGRHLQLDDLPPGADFCVDHDTLPRAPSCATRGQAVVGGASAPTLHRTSRG